MIVITTPAYNEEKTIGKIILDIKNIMDSTKYKYNILVINDGSQDNTAQIAKKAGAIVYSHPYNYGLAETFRTEIQKCLDLKADIIIHTDADGQYPSHYIPDMINKVKEGYDLVLGTRFGKGKYSGSFMKKIGNIVFAKVFSNLLKTKITDTTTGFRAFNSKVAKLPLINSFTYTQEQLMRTKKAKMKIGEIPIITNKTRKSKLFKNSFDYAIKAWINLFRIYRDYEPLKFFGLIGFLFTFPGFLIGLWFLYLHLTTGIQGHLGLLFLMLILIFTGIQIVIFGFLADTRRK